MPDRRNRSIRRPSVVVLALGAATLAALPQTGVLVSGPEQAAAFPISEAGPDLAALLTAAVPATAAERAGRPPGAEGIRINPVAFRTLTPAGPSSATPGRPFAPGADQPRITTTARPGTAAAAAIDFALAQRGLPYIWGGNGPQQGDAGFDCSGLTTAAYDYAGIDLPRTAHTQFYAGPHLASDAELQPGDLVFYGVPQRVHHVGLYIGEGRMVAAPTFGKPVRISYVRYNGDDYLGATRPAAGRDAGELDEGLLATPDLPVEVPPIPDATIPPAPEEFAAPEVPAEELPPPPPAEMLALPEEAPAVEDGAAREGDEARPADESQADDESQSDEGDADDQDSGDQDSDDQDSDDAGDSDDDSDSGDGSGDDASDDEQTMAAGPSGGGAASETPQGTAVPPSDAAETVAPDQVAPETGTPETTEPQASTTEPQPSETTPTEPTPTEPTPTEPTTSTEPTTPVETPSAEATPDAAAPDAAAQPVAITLPGGTELVLSGADRGEDGLPLAPAGPTDGGLRFSPAEEGRAARATVSLHPDADTGSLEPGAVLVLRGEDGTTTELTVRSRDTVDADTAADLASDRGESTRLVLLLADPDTGEVLVVIAE